MIDTKEEIPMEIVLIVAMTEDRVIGAKGALPWSIPTDMDYFRRQTVRNAVVMGRRTCESMHGPLRDRLNIVLSSKKINRPRVVWTSSLDSAVKCAKERGYTKLFIIGGAQLYASALASGIVSKMLITIIKADYTGDTFFPEVDWDSWELTGCTEFVDPATQVHGEFRVYVPKATGSYRSDYVDPTYAGSDVYRGALQEILVQGVCPFCPEHFTWHKEPILKETTDWLLTPSSWPYENAQYHFLIICKTHKENINELSANDLGQVLDLVNWAVESYGLEGGGLALRFGSTKYTGATVVHLHFHLIVPNLDGENRAEPVCFPIG